MLLTLQRQNDPSDTAGSFSAVLKGQSPFVRFRYLAPEDQPDARATRFRRKEGNKQVSAVGDAGAFVADLHLDLRTVSLPGHRYLALGLQSGINRVLNEVEEKLIELVTIRINLDVWAWQHPHL